MSTSPSVRFDSYWSVLRRRWLAVAAGLILGLIGAGLVLGLAPKRYVASCEVLVLPLRTDLTSTSSTGSLAVVNLDTEAQIVRSAPVLAAVRAELRTPRTTEQLAADVRVTAPANTTILSLTFPAASPAAAQRGALAFAHAYLASRTSEGEEVIAARKQSLQVNIDALQGELQRVAPAAEFSASPVDRALAEARRDLIMRQLNSVTGKLQRLSTTPLDPGQIIHEPPLPARPESPVPELVGPSGLMAGLLLGIAFAALRERLDRRVRAAVPYGLDPLLATVHRNNPEKEPSGPAVMRAEFEEARRLANMLLLALERDPALHVVVMLPVGIRSGVLTAQVAVATARAGRNTLLVPAARSHDAAAEVVGAASVPRLLLAEPAQWDVESVRPLVTDEEQTHDLVLVEAPPITAGSDAQTLASWADGVVVGFAPRFTRRAELATALGQLERVGALILGSVAIIAPRRIARLFGRRGGSPAPVPAAAAPEGATTGHTDARVPATRR
jgi:capsular polysaccharide biosynthesis protein